MNFRWRLTNQSGRSYRITAYGTVTGGGVYYDSGGGAQAYFKLNGETVFSLDDSGKASYEKDAIYASNISISIANGQAIDIDIYYTDVGFNPFGNGETKVPYPDGITLECLLNSYGDPQEKWDNTLAITFSDPVDSGGGGGGGSGGGPSGPTTPASNQGTEYTVKSRHNVYATVTRWTYPPLFGVKLLTPPPAPPQLFYPTTAGPNYTGSLGGMLLTPAMVYDIPDDAGGYVADMEAAGVRFKLSPDEISCEVSVGILPFKDA